MASVPHALPVDWTVADALATFGPIPLSRIRRHPAPGTATTADVARIHDVEKRLCELVDGVLVEKTVGSMESVIAIRLAMWIGQFVEAHRLGATMGADGMVELAPEHVRVPDVSFISNSRLARLDVSVAIWAVAPDLAVEVLSRSNTAKEMERKLADYFTAQVREVWYVDPETRTINVYDSPDEPFTVREPDEFSHSRVLPGLTISLPRLFAKPGA